MTTQPLATTEPPGPDKCAAPPGADIEPNPCTERGSLPRCKLCPRSPTYWRCAPHPAEGAPNRHGVPAGAIYDPGTRAMLDGTPADRSPTLGNGTRG